VDEAWRVHRHPPRAMVLFTRSTYYLTLLSAAVVADVLLRGGPA
jgi:hypothetical protein